jgi:hypothetical protein
MDSSPDASILNEYEMAYILMRSKILQVIWGFAQVRALGIWTQTGKLSQRGARGAGA